MAARTQYAIGYVIITRITRPEHVLLIVASARVSLARDIIVDGHINGTAMRRAAR